MVKNALPSYSIIIPAIVLSAIGVPWLTALLASAFKPIIIFSFIVIIVSYVVALIVSEQKPNYCIPPILSNFWIFFHSVVFALLALLI